MYSRSTPPEVEPNDELNIKTGRITRIEIKNAIKKLKNGKAAGCDNIPPEAIKAGEDTSEEVLLDLCNRIWSEEKMPEEWKRGLLIKLPKKGDLSYCKNWRGIMLLNMASKVFCRVILERIKTALDGKLRQEQAGFRAGRSCTDQIATLRLLWSRASSGSSPCISTLLISKRPSIVSAERFCGSCCGTTGCLTRWLPSSEFSMKVFRHRWYTMVRRLNH